MRRFWPLLLFVIMAVTAWFFQPSGSVERTSTTDAPERIISLAPSITEILFALGLDNRITAVTDYCVYPGAAQDKPSVGGYLDPSLETLVSLRPDLVILLRQHTRLAEQLNALGIETKQVDNSRLPAILESIQIIGDATHTQSAADELLNDMQSRIEAVKTRISGKSRPEVLLSIANYNTGERLNQVYVAGQQDFYNDLLEIAGGRNVYQYQNIAVPAVSREGIMRLNPEVIVDIFPGPDEHSQDLNKVRRLWQQLDVVQAIQNERLYIIEADYATKPGPRVIDLLEELAVLIHPQLH